MGAYDDKIDWYDTWMPGSLTTAIVKGANPFESIGGLVNDVTGATSTNKFNAQEAHKQRDWEEYMSKTAYQRAVKDMKAAGLSPAMFYQSGGQGAAVPSGASASGQVGRSMNIIGQTAGLINSITNARKVDAITKSNEITRKDANGLYKMAMFLAKMMG